VLTVYQMQVTITPFLWKVSCDYIAMLEILEFAGNAKLIAFGCI
jgi:hypothetical protein